MNYPYMFQPQPSQVVRVNGEPGARTYAMAANSSALLLDESGLLVWLVTTDGAGYKTVTPYDITPHKVEPAPDSLESRVKRLEELINGYTADTTATRRDDPPAGQANHADCKGIRESRGNA